MQLEQGKIYNLFGKNGIEEVRNEGLKIGQVVSYEDMANPRKKYVVVPGSTEYGQNIISLDARIKKTVSITSIEGLGGWKYEPEVLSMEEVQRIILAHPAAKKQAAQEYQEKINAANLAYENQVASLLREYRNFLELKEFSTKRDHALAAANIRKELKRAFPNCKFSVKSESYTGGDSVHIDWIDGPPTVEVDKIADKYQKGNFNGMEDIYEYNQSAFCGLFGGVKYVISQRNVSNENIIKVAAEMGYTIQFTDRREMVFSPPVENKWDVERMIYREARERDYYNK